jgi:DNA-binding SARP family transcriptional activator
MTETSSTEAEVCARPADIDVWLLGGPVTVFVDGRQAGLTRQEQLLAAQLFRAAGTFVSAGRLIEQTWDGAPGQRPGPRLHELVKEVRSALRKAAPAAGRLIVTRDGGYVAMVDPARVDMHRFDALHQRAQEHARCGDYEMAATAWRAALGEWHAADLVQPGEPLTGLHGRWVTDVRGGLEEEHTAALLGLLDAHRRIGQDPGAIGLLRRLAEAKPGNEAVSEAWMVALYQAGRQQEALGVYRRLYDRLAEDGLEPSPRLAALYTRMLNHDPGLDEPAAHFRPTAAEDAQATGEDAQAASGEDIPPPTFGDHRSGGVYISGGHVKARTIVGRDMRPDPHRDTR